MKHLSLLPFVLLAAGCLAGRNYQAPTPALPAAFTAAPSTPSEATNLLSWWSVFADADLTTLVSNAAQANLDLRIAEARLRESRARFGLARSALFPQANARGSYSRQRLSENGNAGGQLAAAGQPLESDLFDAGLDMSWEIDLFGARRRAVEAARAQTQAGAESVRDALVTVTSEVALNYLQLRAAHQQLQVARRNLAAQQDTLALTRDRVGAGLAAELDVTRAAAQVARTQALIPPLEETAARAAHRIDVLLGRSPSQTNWAAFTGPAGGSLPPRVPVGLPSDLLRQRPDIRRAERELAAATAETAAAVAEWFPRFYLTGAAGLQSIEAKDFFTGGSGYWSIGPGIRWPIFTAGRIRQNISVQNARQEQALARYEQTVLIALEEVENALIGFGKEQERHAALTESEEASRRSVALATDRYRSGLADFLDVLESERALLAAQDDLVQSELRLNQNAVRLFKALGGGWQRDTARLQLAALPVP